MKKLFLLAMLATFHIADCLAQQLPADVPDNFRVTSQDDCTQQQKNVLPVINWLENTPLQTEDPNYKKARTFLVEWSTWSENVNLELSPDIIKFSESHPDLLLYFIAGWTKFELQHPGAGLVKNNAAGLDAVIRFYKSQKDMANNETLDELYALSQNGELETWVKNKLGSEE